VEISDARIKFRATADANVRVRFFCARYPDNYTVWDQRVPIDDPLESDKFGNPIGGRLLTTGIPNVAECLAEAGKNYAMEWEAVSVESGRSVSTPEKGFQKFKTPAPPPVFAFADPFSITVSPAYFKIKWKSTIRPRTAEVVLLLNDGGSLKLTNTDAKIDDNAVEVTLEVPELLQKREQKDPDLRSPLRFAAKMERDGKEEERRFELNYALDKKGLSGAQKDAVTQLSSMASKKHGKLTWEEMVQLGLPVIMSFF